MKLNKLLDRQLKKIFPEGKYDDESFQQFVKAVNDSYIAYERDHDLANRAFRISEDEYIEVNEKLTSEIEQKKISINKLKEAVAEIGEDSFKQGDVKLLDIATYLKSQISKRKEAEESLRRLSMVASLNDNGVLFTDPTGKITWSNDGFSELTGYTSSEVNGRTPIEVMGGEKTDRATLQKMVDLFFKGENFNVELICYKKDGSWFWGRTTGQSVLDEDENVIQYFSMIEDITTEKAVQEQIKGFEQRFRTALEKIGDNVWEYDFTSGKTYFSNTSNSLLDSRAGHDSVENATLWWSQTHQDDKWMLLETEANYKTGRIDHHTLEYRIVTKDGSVRWVLDRGTVIERTADGKPVKIVGTHTDITERKISEQALQINEEKYRSIIANMNLGLLEIDLDEVIQYANNSFCKMSGFEPDEIIGKKAAGLFTKGEGSEVAETKNELRKKGHSDAYETAVKNKNGESKWWLISGAPRYDDLGNLVGSIGIHLDITDQKKLEIDLYEAREAAEQSTKAKELFLANMSHEIRTPMNAILGMGRQLHKTELNENQHFFLDTINKAAEHLLVVINDILDISKIEAGKLNLESIGFRPEEVIRHCMQIMSHKAEESGLSLQKETGEGISPVLIGDPYRLNQVLLNLISNAVKFTEKGSITVSCRLLQTIQNQQTICISVKDTGIGMEEEFSANLFQKFSQEDKSTTRKYGGTGLGMSISKQLVELMGGSINVKSKKGVGTEITLTIPFDTGNESDLQEETREVSDSAILKDKKVLLVEDNVMNRLVANAVLKGYGVIISEAVNGEEAVNALRHSAYDIVLMDVQMPVMNGLEATRIIRKEINGQVPIIALTASAIKGESDKCIEAGMNDFVSKPFEEEDLVYAMAKWLNKTSIQKTVSMKNNTETKQSLCDLSKLEKIGNGDKGFVTEMVRLFIDQVPADVSHIRAAYSRNDFISVKEIAHKIKPVIDSMGINSLHQKIRKIESVALDAPDSPELNELIKELETVITLVVEELEVK